MLLNMPHRSTSKLLLLLGATRCPIFIETICLKQILPATVWSWGSTIAAAKPAAKPAAAKASAAAGLAALCQLHPQACAVKVVAIACPCRLVGIPAAQV